MDMPDALVANIGLRALAELALPPSPLRTQGADLLSSRRCGRREAAVLVRFAGVRREVAVRRSCARRSAPTPTSVRARRGWRGRAQGSFPPIPLPLRQR
jgi:hypothetical protein